MEFVLDASVTISWFFESQADAYCDSVLEALDNGRARVPGIWLLEVLNVLRIGERKGRISPEKTAAFIERLRSFSIKVEPAEVLNGWPRDLLSLSRTHRLSSYDGAYLELAVRERLPLATRDVPLRRAAASCGVELFAPARSS